MAESDAERVWSLMESMRYCMLSTSSGQQLRSRPMAAFVRRSEGSIYFLTDQRAVKDEEIEQSPQVCLCFADPRRQNYVSVSGRATVSTDRSKIRELWSIPAKVWWNRAGALYLETIGRDDGGQHMGREHARCGQHLPFHCMVWSWVR